MAHDHQSTESERAAGLRALMIGHAIIRDRAETTSEDASACGECMLSPSRQLRGEGFSWSFES